MTRELPESSDSALFLRTDFSDDDAWERVCDSACAATPGDGFLAALDCVSDSSLDGLTAEELVDLVQEPPPYFVFLVDSLTLTHPEHPILAVDLNEEPGRTLRVIPAEISAIENNLSLSNMDFYEFADVADASPDRIFRGF